MAQRVRIELFDDLSEDTPADETVTFGLDGVTYEIDLSRDNASELRDVLAPYVGAARKVAGRRQSKGRAAASSSSGSGASANEIRAWARAQGMEVSDRGRVRDEVRAAYDAAH